MVLHYITIDFDAKEKAPLTRIMFLIRLKSVCRETECYAARTSKGYHVYIKVSKYDFWRAIALRAMLYDDIDRINWDISKHHRGLDKFIETLFHYKQDVHGKPYYNEEPISIYDIEDDILEDNLFQSR